MLHGRVESCGKVRLVEEVTVQVRESYIKLGIFE